MGEDIRGGSLPVTRRTNVQPRRRVCLAACVSAIAGRKDRFMIVVLSNRADFDVEVHVDRMADIWLGPVEP